jgi:hypothetical protein
VDVGTFRLIIIEHRQYGLDGHSRCEGDISATRRDYYTNNGDNHNAYPDRFKRLIQLAKQKIRRRHAQQVLRSERAAIDQREPQALLPGVSAEHRTRM